MFWNLSALTFCRVDRVEQVVYKGAGIIYTLYIATHVLSTTLFQQVSAASKLTTQTTMPKNWLNCSSLFHVLCVCAAISMTIYCSLEFVKNEDVSEITYKTFNGEYPVVTLCFNFPYIDDRLKQYGKGINSSTYSLFVNGEFWDERMRNKAPHNYTFHEISITGNRESQI